MKLNRFEDLLASLEDKARDLEGHADATTSSFFEAVYRGQAAILRELAAERIADRSRLQGEGARRRSNRA